jgi:alpha-N-arabinofuranosidase
MVFCLIKESKIRIIKQLSMKHFNNDFIIKLLLGLLLLNYGQKAKSQTPGKIDTLKIDVSKVINDTRRRQIGINTCILTDDDKCYFRKPVRHYNDAIKELKVKYLRYPGGYKSDVIFWSKPPYLKPDPNLVYGTQKWPGSDTSLVNKDGTWRIDPYDFDEFMETCKATGAEPVIVVTYNSLRWIVADGINMPNKEQIIENARQWVHYANIVKNYGVKYWEIGNETWLNTTDENGWNIKRIEPEIYASDIPDISKAMKSVDSTILIGVNGDSEKYLNTILGMAVKDIDYLSVHSYPLYGLKSYDEYLNKDVDAGWIINEAKRAIQQNSMVSKKQIKIMVTEFASGTFHDWDREGSNIRNAIATFDLQGQLLQNPDCWFSQFWNTINVYDKDNSIFNALWQNNSLTAMGKALSIWGNYLEDEMLETKSTQLVKCFATHTKGKYLTIFAINKDTVSHSVKLNIINNQESLKKEEIWTFKGTSAVDKYPVFARQSNLKVSQDKTIIIPPVSLTMFRFETGKK